MKPRKIQSPPKKGDLCPECIARAVKEVMEKEYMKTTVRRLTLSLTKEDAKCLEDLMKHNGETQTDVLKRALILLNHVTFQTKEMK